jgi:hypothetical protein
MDGEFAKWNVMLSGVFTENLVSCWWHTKTETVFCYLCEERWLQCLMRCYNNFLCLSSRGIDRLAFIQLNAAQIINSEFWFSFSSAPNSVSSLLVRHAESTVEMRALISAMLILNDYCCINVEFEIKAVAVVTLLGMYVLNYVWSYNYGKIYNICIGLSFLMIFCPNKLNVSKFLRVQTGTMSLVVYKLIVSRNWNNVHNNRRDN